jgi:hypothetical protein
MQQLVDKVMTELIHLKTFYIFVCPAQKLSIKSRSLEKLCIYKSEHVELHSLNLPKLKILMLQGDLIELVFKANQVRKVKLGYNEIHRTVSLCSIRGHSNNK